MYFSLTGTTEFIKDILYIHYPESQMSPRVSWAILYEVKKKIWFSWQSWKNNVCSEILLELNFHFFFFFFNFLFYCINLPHKLYHKSHAAFLVQCNNTFSHLIRIPHAKGKSILLNRKYYKLAKLANLRVWEKHFCIFFSMIMEQIIVQVNVW